MEHTTTSKYSGTDAVIADMRRRFAYFTGGVFRPDLNDPMWIRLALQIRDSGYTVSEFLYFCANHLRGENDPQILTWKAYITCDKVWKQFLEFKHTRREDVKILVQLQHESFDNNLKIFGTPMEILLDDQFSLNAAVRVDIALSLNETAALDPTPVINKYKSAVLYLCSGSPEYRQFCWFLDKWLLARDRGAIKE